MCLTWLKPTRETEEDEDYIELLIEETKAPKNPLITAKGAQIFFMGDPGCGKTSIVRRVANEGYVEPYLPTLGIEYKTAWIKLDGPPFKVLMLDPTGRLCFDTHTIDLLQMTDCFVFVFDLTQLASAVHISKWLSDITSNLQQRNPPARRILIGNKADCADRVVGIEDIESILESVDQYIETSAKEGMNIERLLKYMGGTDALK